MQKRRNPTGVSRQGFDQGQVLQASSEIDTATTPHIHQDHRAAEKLARRFNLSLSVAAAYCEIHRLGEVWA